MTETATELAAENTELTPIAIVRGQAVTTVPKDLYIPPDALEVFLEAFEGPMDLLLYLIKRQNLNILDISISQVTQQYMAYVELMKKLSLELAAEYLVMAALLAEIKSRMLLPRPESETEDEEDPRAELIRRLQEYERYKKAAEEMDQLPRQGRDTFVVQMTASDIQVAKPIPQVTLRELILAFQEVMTRAALTAHHRIQREPLSVHDRMTIILTSLKDKEFIPFNSLFTLHEGRMGVVVTFLAMLELIKHSMIDIVQAGPFSPIHIKAIAA